MEKIRNLPTFIIIGVIKGGTSGLYWTMGKHPKIQLADIKELMYFQGKKYRKNLNNYRSFFPICAKNEITGESTPSYILYEKVARRIKYSLPKVKVIILLRNPIDRAYSQYYHAVRNVNRRIYPKILPFNKLIDKEFQGKIPYKKHMGKDLLKRGIYVDQLKMWYKYFPKKQIKIIKSKDYFAHPNKILNEIFKFLGLKPFTIKEIIIPDKRIYPKSMNKRTLKLLKQYYIQHNKQLYELIGRDMGWENEI